MAADSARRTMLMSWDGLGSHSDEDSDERFYDSTLPVEFSSSSSDDDFDDSRMSFASAVSSGSAHHFNRPAPTAIADQQQQQQQHQQQQPQQQQQQQPQQSSMANYDVWMATPAPIKERRKRLLQGMGLNSNKDLFRATAMRLMSGIFDEKSNHPPPPENPSSAGQVADDRQPESSEATIPAAPREERDACSDDPDSSSVSAPVSCSPPKVASQRRSRSDGAVELDSYQKNKRCEQIIGSDVSKERLMRTASTLASRLEFDPKADARGNERGDDNPGDDDKEGRLVPKPTDGNQLRAFFRIKNLDTGTEFVVREVNQDGMWNRLRNLQTGKHLTMEEFEETVGHSPVVKELMKREEDAGDGEQGESADRKHSTFAKRLRGSKRRGVSLLKNLKSAAKFNEEKEKEVDALVQQHQKSAPLPPAPSTKSNASSSWIKVRQQGKTHKELSALRLCQEIHAHEGSIWTMKFNVDGKYLATAGEDKVIHVWEVQECEIATCKSSEDVSSTSSSINLSNCSLDSNLSTDLSSGQMSKKKKWKLARRKVGKIPHYVQLPDTVFCLSDKPFCSFTGHQNDVLDLSWSRSQLHFLSSSMDKTVRLWDLETQSCLGMFSHNDYVTCIHFNPTDDNYFISGSLDAKLRIWSVSGRCVVDWHDLHDMVTAACYSPDGQSAAVGSNKGCCRMYSTADGKLNQISQFDLRNKKKKKPSKITGFEFTPGNPSEVLVTSADSRIRIYDGLEVVQKFIGFRNTSSQISSSYSPSGRHVISASEDSNVYMWKWEETQQHGVDRNSKGKTYAHVRSYEQFPCKDVSVAIPWPGSAKFEPTLAPPRSKKHSKRYSQLLPVSYSPKRPLLPPLSKKIRHHNHGASAEKENVAEHENAEAGESPKSEATGAESPAPSSSSQDGGGAVHVTAWGLVIVTAGLGGEIKAFQNFGLPVKVRKR